jgi:hypothetical protein
MAVATGRAEAKETPISGSVSGSFVNTQVDTNGDGLKGSLVIGAGDSTSLGKFTAQSVSEVVFSAEATCPNGNAGFELTLVPGTGHFVHRLHRTGDLWFGTFTVTECFDPITGILFVSGTLTITGGTGKYEGATGSGTFEGTGTALFEDAAGNFFGQFSQTISGTINTNE